MGLGTKLKNITNKILDFTNNGRIYAVDDVGGLEIDSYIDPQDIIVSAINSINDVIVFTDLNDAPDNYSGAASKYIKVNAGATGLEFQAITKAEIDLLGINASELGGNTYTEIMTAVDAAIDAKVTKAFIDALGINATQLNGKTASTAGTADTIALRDVSADITAHDFKLT